MKNKTLVKSIIGLFILDIVLTLYGVGYLGLRELNIFGRYVIENYSIWLLPIFLPISFGFTLWFIPWMMKKFIVEKEQSIAVNYYYVFCLVVGTIVQTINICQLMNVVINQRVMG